MKFHDAVIIIEAMPSTAAKCVGKMIEDGMLWHNDCRTCVRRLLSMHTKANQISPWTGHGPCPDKVETQI